MALSAGSVFVTLGGRFSPAEFNRFGAATQRAGGDMERAEKRVRTSAERSAASLAAMGHAAKVGAGAGIAALGAGLVYSIKKAADFEQQMSRVGSVSGATGKQMQQLRKSAMDAGAATRFSALDAARAQEELARGGLSVANILRGGLRSALSLAAAGGLGLADAATYTANAMNLFGIEGRQAGHVADALATAANATTADVGDFGIALSQSGGAARAAGLSFDQTVVALEMLARSGVRGSDAGTSLRTTINQLAAPTRRSATLQKELGLSFFDSGGRIRNVSDMSGMLFERLHKLTPQQREAAAATIAGSDGMRTLLAMYDGGRKQADFYTHSLRRQGSAAEVAARNQDNFKGKLENFKGSVETAAISLGSKLLPTLTRWATRGTEFVNKLDSSGKISSFADTVTKGFGVAEHVFGDFVHTGGQVAGVLHDIGAALHLGDPHNLEAIAVGFAAFRIAGVVAPMVATLASGISNLVMNARTASSAGAFLGDLGLMANPITAVATGVSILAGAMMLLAGNEKSEADAARDVVSAKKDELAAIQAVNDAILSAADSTFAARDADAQLTRARQALAAAAKRYGTGSPQYKRALLDEQEAALRDTSAHNRLRRARDDMAVADKKARDAARTTVDQAGALRDTRISDATDDFYAGFIDQAGLLDATRDAWKRYNDTLQQAAKGTAAAAISQIQLARVLSGQKLLTDNQAVSVANLARVFDSLPKNTKLQLAATSGPALAQIGDLVGRLRNLPKQQVVQILANASSARMQIAALTAAVNGVPTRRIIKIESSAESERVKILELTAAAHGIPQSVVSRIMSTAGSERVRIAALTAVINGVPKSLVLRITSSAASERVKVAALTAAIRGVPPEKISKILADGAAGATGQVNELNAAINALHDRTVTVTATTVKRTINEIGTRLLGALPGHKASGRRAGAAEAAIVGESPTGPREYVIDRNTGAGYITNGPALVGLGKDDYVVPTEARERGGALGLFAMLAKDLGVDGYAGGKHPAARKKAPPRKPHDRFGPVPAKIRGGGVDFADVKQHYTDAESSYKRAVDAERNAKKNHERAVESSRTADRRGYKLRSGPDKGKWSNAVERENAVKRAKDTETLYERAKKVSHDRKPGRDRRKLEYEAAKRYDDKIRNAQSDVNLFTQAMSDADDRDNDQAYKSAQRSRIDKLKFLVKTLQGAYKLADHNSDYGRQVRDLLVQYGGRPAADGRGSEFGGEIAAAAAPQTFTDPTSEERMAQDEADAESSTGMTAAERKRLTDINADIALAALTEDPRDDITGATELRDFLTGVLGEVQADPSHRGGSVVVADIAGQLRTARDNLESLVNPSGGSSNSNPDLQAQLDQANQRVAAAEASARTANDAVAVFGGSGDIGAGGPNALRAAAGGSTVNVYTLHPGDPATLSAIGSAATAGIGLQGSRRAVRTSPGI
jgi:TP901 family phage tail tape measure protein